MSEKELNSIYEELNEIIKHEKLSNQVQKKIINLFLEKLIFEANDSVHRINREKLSDKEFWKQVKKLNDERDFTKMCFNSLQF